MRPISGAKITVSAEQDQHLEAVTDESGNYALHGIKWDGIYTSLYIVVEAPGYVAQGAIEYASLTMVQAQVTDGDIYHAIAGVLPVATIGWTRITD